MQSQIAIKHTSREPQPSESKPQRLDSLEKFLRWRRPEGRFKYEWNRGAVEKTPKMITYKTLFIVDNLVECFDSIKKNLPDGGRLFTEPQTMVSQEQLRIPDVAFFSKTEIRAAADGGWPVPKFVAELVSDNDAHRKVLEKVDEYFAAGVEIVWLIFPENKLVYVYRSPIDVVICRGETVCSAEPVLGGFLISAEGLFRKN